MVLRSIPEKSPCESLESGLAVLFVISEWKLEEEIRAEISD